MKVSIYYGLSKPLTADNSHVYRWKSHADMKEWLNRYSAGKIVYEINTVFPTDGGFIDAPLSFEMRPEYVVCEIANTAFCYFVSSIQYLAENSTRIFLSVDAWGTFYGIGDSVAGKFVKCHLIQGHYNKSDIFHVPAIDSIQSNVDYLSIDNHQPIGLKKSFLFDRYVKSKLTTCVFIFAGANNYYTVIATSDSFNPSITISEAISAYEMSNRYTKFGYIEADGSISSVKIDLNALVSAYIFPQDILEIPLDFGANGKLLDGVTVLQSAKIVESSLETFEYSAKTKLNNYGVSHFVQIGTKIFNLPQIGKPHNYRIKSMLTKFSVKVYFTVDEQTEEITDEFSLTVYSDTAKNFWNQNAASVALQMTASAIGAVGSIASGNVIGAVGSTLAIGQQTANIVSRTKQPCKINGSPAFYFTANTALQCGAEFALPAVNQDSVVSDINNRGFAIDTWRDDPEIDNQPNFLKINDDGTENTEEYIYSQFVQVDYLTLKNSICSPSSIDRLRAAFFAGIVVHHEWQSGIL